MPELSRFFGIIITMFYDDHAPPHFHVRYAEHKAIITIDSLTLLEGHLPPRVFGLVAEWGGASSGRAERRLAIGRATSTAQEDQAAGVMAC
jgi:hypothetical protein